jgi:hypothetical protein
MIIWCWLQCIIKKLWDMDEKKKIYKTISLYTFITTEFSEEKKTN